MANLFYTLFKYKEKAQKDELGYYPEKVNVRAFPERRYLWTSRFFVVISCLSMCLNMILGAILCLLIPMRKTNLMPMQIDYNRYQVTHMENVEGIAFAGDLVTESILDKYIKNRYTIGDSLEELKQRLGENEFVYLATKDDAYQQFSKTELPYFEMLYRKGVRREVVTTSIYPVSYDFWQVRFKTIDTYPDRDEPLISDWIATIRMIFNFNKYEDKSLSMINPFGLTVLTYDLSYMGNNIKSERH